MKYITQFPHCDSKILHAPEDNCKHCNAHPEWQELRKYWGIAFTGHSDELVRYTDWEGHEVVKTLIPCPSEWARPIGVINKWGGNVPFTPEAEEAMEKYYSNMKNMFAEEGINEYPDQQYDSHDL